MRLFKPIFVLILVTATPLSAPSAKMAINSDPPVNVFLNAIVTWLSSNFELPAIYKHPVIELMPANQISDIRYKTIAPKQRREVIAIYDDNSRKIVLSENWAGNSAVELSVLVHEMVHHLQNMANLNYECAAAREELAYAAQAKWLKLFGSNLHRALEIDQLTLKLATTCMLR